MHVFYLHGFASSAQSTKATYLRARFAPHGIELHCPDFNEPEFSSLTVTRMLDQVEQAIAALDHRPVVLIGSSLGAVVAIHIADRLPDRVARLVLLAPALMFPRDAGTVLGRERVDSWQATGALDVFHYAYGATRRLDYAFYQDGLEYDSLSVPIRQAVLIFQGLRDEAVDHRMVEKYAASKPNVRLTLVDDDHQLAASLPRIWTEMSAFLGLS